MKTRSQKLLLILLAVLAPFISHAEGQNEVKRFGAYRVFLSQDFESGIGRILIKRGKNKVFEEADVDYHYYFGNNFDEKQRSSHSFKNITGNGIPNLVVSNWTGGVHCCHFLTIFELGKDFRKIVTVQANSSTIRLIDLDRDGYPEIEFWDGAIDYLFASFAGSPGGRVVLKFDKDHYDVALDLMKKPAPTSYEIEKIKKRVVKAFKNNDTPELPYDFLEVMMDLSYSGHFKLAMKLVDNLWPSNRPEIEQFKSSFSEALHRSQYFQWEK